MDHEGGMEELDKLQGRKFQKRRRFDKIEGREEAVGARMHEEA